MSETATQLNIGEEVAQWCRRLGGMYAKDLAAIEESKYTVSQGGVARTIADFTSEVCGFNYMVVKALNGLPLSMPDDDERAAFQAQFADKEFAMRTVVDSANALADAIESASSETLVSTMTTPWGETMNTFTFANIAVNHILYHDAQLNFIQSLDGDGQMHWSDGA